MNIHLHCPHCKNPIELVKLQPHQDITCTACGSTFRVEGMSTTRWTPGETTVGRFEIVEEVGHRPATRSSTAPGGVTVMEQSTEPDDAWNVFLTRYEEGEYHGLSKEDLLDIVTEEWDRDFNGIFIGRDKDCVGRLIVFYYGSLAYVAYEDFESPVWRCSYDLSACDAPDWDDMVRLTPDDTHDFSFVKCSLIPKERARTILIDYVNHGSLSGLYISGQGGKPRLT